MVCSDASNKSQMGIMKCYFRGVDAHLNAGTVMGHEQYVSVNSCSGNDKAPNLNHWWLTDLRRKFCEIWITIQTSTIEKGFENFGCKITATLFRIWSLNKVAVILQPTFCVFPCYQPVVHTLHLLATEDAAETWNHIMHEEWLFYPDWRIHWLTMHCA